MDCVKLKTQKLLCYYHGLLYSFPVSFNHCVVQKAMATKEMRNENYRLCYIRFPKNFFKGFIQEAFSGEGVSEGGKAKWFHLETSFICHRKALENNVAPQS